MPMSRSVQSILVMSVILVTLVTLASDPIEELAAALASIPRETGFDSDDAEDARGAEGRPAQSQSISRPNIAGSRRSVSYRLIARQGRHLLAERPITDQQYSFRS